jgi:hypothetical protein
MIRYFLFGAAVAAIGWVAIARHRPPPLPEVREERAYGKGDLLFVHRDPPPPPMVEEAPAPVVVSAEPPPPKKREERRKNICELKGGVKVEYNRGRSWRCKFWRR